MRFFPCAVGGHASSHSIKPNNIFFFINGLSYGPQCSSLHHQPNLTDICGFVRNTSSCDIDDGFINYTQLLYCNLADLPVWLACVFLVSEAALSSIAMLHFSATISN